MLTLKPALFDVQDLTGVSLKRVYVDKGYRGKKHHPEGLEVNVSGHHLRPLSAYRRRLARRRSCVEAMIGHLKWDGRMGRNFLLGEQGDGTNAVLSGSGQNLRKLMKEAYGFPSFFVLFFKRLYNLFGSYCFP